MNKLVYWKKEGKDGRIYVEEKEKNIIGMGGNSDRWYAKNRKRFN